MGTADNLIHELLDHAPVALHVPHIHPFGNLIALHGDLLHHQIQSLLQAGFFDMAGKCEFKTAVTLLYLLLRLHRRRRGKGIDFYIHTDYLQSSMYIRQVPLIKSRISRRHRSRASL